MDIPYIDFPDGPFGEVPPPGPLGDQLVSVAANPDASVLLGITVQPAGYQLAVSFDYGTTWSELEDVGSVGHNESSLPIDLWFEVAQGRFVVLVNNRDWEEPPVFWMTSEDGMSWQEQYGPAPDAPGRQRDGEVITEVPNGFVASAWPTWDQPWTFPNRLAQFSADGDAWAPINLPPTTVAGAGGITALDPGFMGRPAAMPNGRFFIASAGSENWSGIVEFHFGEVIRSAFWMNHIKTVEHI